MLYNFTIMPEETTQTEQNTLLNEDELLYGEAREIVITQQQASVAFLQRKLRIGYSRGARLLDMLEERGVVGEADGAKPREVLMKSVEEQDKEVVKDTTKPAIIADTYEPVQGVIVNDDFSYIGKNGKTYTLQFKQKRFADLYLELSGDRIEAIIEAGYDVNYKNNKGEDTGVPNRQLCSVMAYELLNQPHISSYINAKMSEMGFNNENVEEQHLFLLNQHADLKMKGKAIDMYYKVKGKYPKEPKNVTNNLNVFSLADLADKSTKRKQMGLPPVKVEAVEVGENPVVEPPKVHPAFARNTEQNSNGTVTDS